MSDSDHANKLNELDRLLNDPDVPMQPDRIWSLLADLSPPDILMPRTRSIAGKPVFADR